MNGGHERGACTGGWQAHGALYVCHQRHHGGAGVTDTYAFFVEAKLSAFLAMSQPSAWKQCLNFLCRSDVSTFLDILPSIYEAVSVPRCILPYTHRTIIGHSVVWRGGAWWGTNDVV